MNVGSFLVAQQVKDSALPLLWLESLLWYGFDSWPGNFCMSWPWPKISEFLKIQIWISLRPTICTHIMFLGYIPRNRISEPRAVSIPRVMILADMLPFIKEWLIYTPPNQHTQWLLMSSSVQGIKTLEFLLWLSGNEPD